jgi:nucleoside-diphosphate-sugar epimerase
MQYAKILITGASGFIGSRLCEKFKLQYGLPHRALVHNFSKAARIARLGTEMAAGDLADPAQLDAALSGCDAVVHLAFGDAKNAEENLLAACRRAGVKRFIHTSSMAVHGPTPGPECAHEATATIGHYNHPYSDAKARAETVVARALAQGLRGVILRPTIVYGPYSPFVTRVVEAARTGAISLIDEGRGVCNAVYVDDVCDAIHAALESDRALGKALFITADQAVSWKEFNLAFATMVEPPPRVGNVPAREARAYWESRKPSFKSNLAAVKRLVASSDFHDQLETVPAVRSAMKWTKTNLKKILSADRVTVLKSAGAGRSGAGAPAAWPDAGRLDREDFHLVFSNALAKSTLDWKPAYDFPAGAAITRTWLEFACLLRPAS